MTNKVDKKSKIAFKIFINNPEVKVLIPPLIIIIALFIIGQLVNPGFGSLSNIGNIVALAMVLTIGAAGQTLIIISGGTGKDGIDLSVGALMSMGAVIGSGLLRGNDSNLFLTFVLLCLLGAFFGSVGGSGVVWLGIPPLVITLALSSVVDGFTLAVSKGRPFGAASNILLAVGGNRYFGWLRLIVIVGIVIVVLFTLLLRKSRYGKKLFLTGNNQAAAKINGINSKIVVLIAFIIAGIMGTIGGLFLLANVGSAQMQMGSRYTMLSIAAVVLGGTELTGGRGSYIGTAFGAIVIITLTNILTAVNMQQGWRLMIIGGVVVTILSIYARRPSLRQ